MPKTASFSINYKNIFQKKLVNFKNQLTFASALNKSGRKIRYLLQKLNLIELNKPFHSITKGFYILAGFSMIILSILTIIFSLYVFAFYLFTNIRPNLLLFF